MRLFSTQYPPPQHEQNEAAKCGAFFSMGRRCSVLRAPQMSTRWETLCPSRGMSVPIICILTPQDGNTCISKHIWLICTHRHLYLLRETCAKSCGLPLLFSFCLAHTSLQNPTELDCSQCYPWDHGKIGGGKSNDVARAGFWSFW